MSTRICIQHADRSDREELRVMQAASFRVLGAPFYDADVVESFIADIGTMDDNLLGDGTYFKAVDGGRIVGSGGWSWRTPAYASRAEGMSPPPHANAASVRSIFVHPDFARRGIARTIVALIEAEMVAAGFSDASLTATLCGIPFYRRLGYRGGRPVALRLPKELTFVGLGMAKPLAGAAALGGRAA